MRLLALSLLVSVGCGSAAGDLPQKLDGGGPGDGAVVECTSRDDCSVAEICVEFTCLPAGCGDAQISGNESDIDCGGDCLACSEGELCNAARDCGSRYCDGFNRCRDCQGPKDCEGAPGTYCLTGVCVNQFDDGDSCTGEEQCSSGVCGFEDVCCNSACSGTCSDGTCQELAAVANYTTAAPDDCITNLSNPITYQASPNMHVCVHGLRPGKEALGAASVGDVLCSTLVFTELGGNVDWEYEAARAVWHGTLKFIGPSGVAFTSCYKNKGESDVLKVYTVVAPASAR